MSKNLEFTVSPRMAKEFELDAWMERLILEAREAERVSPLRAEEFAQETDALRQYGAERARALGIAVEEEIDQIVYDLRSNE